MIDALVLPIAHLRWRLKIAQRGLGGICWGAVLAACPLAGAAVGNASSVPGSREHHCDVGGPPAWPVMPAFSPGMKQLSPEVIIACGRRLLGRPYEIVALDTSEGLWVYFDSVHFWKLSITREPLLPGSLEPAITIGYGGWGPPDQDQEVQGVLAANVARVEVISHDKSQRRLLGRDPHDRPSQRQITDRPSPDKTVWCICDDDARLCASEGDSRCRLQCPWEAGRICEGSVTPRGHRL